MLALAWRKCRCFEAVKLGSVAGLFANMEDYVRIASGSARNHRRVDMRRGFEALAPSTLGWHVPGARPSTYRFDRRDTLLT